MATWHRIDVYERDGFKCVYCGFDGTTFEGWRFLEVDHVNPKGGDGWSNLVTACRSCNGSKGNDPCESLEQAKKIVKGHDDLKRAYWAANVKPRL